MYRYELSPAESPSEGIYRTVAILEDTPPEELAPLGSTIDTDALDSFCARNGKNHCAVTFDYCGYEVTVDRDSIAVESVQGT